MNNLADVRDELKKARAALTVIAQAAPDVYMRVDIGHAAVRVEDALRFIERVLEKDN